MKRFLIAIALFTVTAGVLSSCKSHERCPAYGQIEKADQKAVRV